MATRRAEVFDTAPSTNALVAERARTGAGEGLVVVAEHQTAGRGRLDRTWETPARAALTVSVLLRPRVAAMEWPWFPLLTGRAVAVALRNVGATVGLKWPNDVLLDDRKVGGILTERVDTPSGAALVVGVGINVGMTREQLPVETNVALTCGAQWNGTAVRAFRAGAGLCTNTGEIASVLDHEWGHGMDANGVNASISNPSEGIADVYSAYRHHDSCIGPNFRTGVPCSGYGDPCTGSPPCTGVRDIDWGQHARNTPSTVANFTQTDCPGSASYEGPCGEEGHCESLVSSEALWDFPMRDLPSPGSGSAWSITERLCWRVWTLWWWRRLL